MSKKTAKLKGKKSTDWIKTSINVSREGYARVEYAVEVRKRNGPGRHSVSSLTDELYWGLPEVPQERKENNRHSRAMESVRPYRTS